MSVSLKTRRTSKQSMAGCSVRTRFLIWAAHVSTMVDMKYSLVIEATEDPNFFGFYSPDLEGFTGVGNSIEDCLYKAKWGMEEHVALLRERGFPVPRSTDRPKVVIQNVGPLRGVAT